MWTTSPPAERIGRLRPLASTLTALALALACAACGGSSGPTPTSTGATAPGPSVSLRAPTHRPRAGAPWPIAIESHRPGGGPLRSEVRYQYLFAGSVVARRSHYRFTGSFHDTFHWPARAVGIPLTFRAVVTTPLGTRRLDYPVRVRR